MSIYDGFACPTGRFRSRLEFHWNIELRKRFSEPVQYVDRHDCDFTVGEFNVEIKPHDEEFVWQAARRIHGQLLVIASDSPGDFEAWWIAYSDYIEVQVYRFLRPPRQKGSIASWVEACWFETELLTINGKPFVFWKNDNIKSSENFTGRLTIDGDLVCP